MDANTFVKANGVLFSPQEMTVSIQAVDYDSGRTADGTMHRNMVAQKYKYSIKLAPMHSGDELVPGGGQTLPDLLNVLMKAEFTFEAPDPVTMGVKSGTFYVGDRSIPVYNFKLDIWDSLSFDVIEV